MFRRCLSVASPMSIKCLSDASQMLYWCVSNAAQMPIRSFQIPCIIYPTWLICIDFCLSWLLKIGHKICLGGRAEIIYKINADRITKESIWQHKETSDNITMGKVNGEWRCGIRMRNGDAEWRWAWSSAHLIYRTQAMVEVTSWAPSSVDRIL